MSDNGNYKSKYRLGKNVVVVLLFAFLLAYCVASWQVSQSNPYRPMNLTGQWICAPGEQSASGYFRKRFDINSPIRHAWIAVAARDGFEVSVNRNPTGRFYLWRPTRPFQNGNSESGLVISKRKPAMALNFPREYQWDGHYNWLMPMYLDITNSLRPGKNVVCIEVESRSLPASASFHGEIQLWNGEVIPIQSDASWNAEPVPLGPQLQDWTEVQYWDKDWRQAVATDGPTSPTWRNVPAEVFSQPFAGKWLRANSRIDKPQSFAVDWDVQGDIDEAWIRLVANRRFELFINENRVDVGYKRSPDLDNGDWVLGRDAALDPIATPELLDPDETSNFFVGEKFENPRDAQANLREFKNLKIKTHLPFRNYKTTNRAEDGGEFDPTRTLSESRRTPEKPDLPADNPIPNQLKRDRAIGGYLAYSVGNLLRTGKNKIEIRPVDAAEFNWRPSFAVDGAVRSRSGELALLPPAKQWHCTFGDSEEQHPVQVGALAMQRNQQLPALKYRGIATSTQSFATMWASALIKILITLFLVGMLMFSISRWKKSSSATEQIAHGESGAGRFDGMLRYSFKILLAASTVLLCGVLIENSLQERHEILWFERGVGWSFVLIAAAVAGVAMIVVETASRMNLNRIRSAGRTVFGNLHELPNTRLWPFIIDWMLLLAVFLRGYKLDMQPLDDDEYASTQAIMAILETGAPGFVPENVYYTRSPLYHYLTAAVAWPFGGNLWSLRLQSVFWSVATALLTYFCGSRLLNSRWIGFAALTLISIHPFEVFTGHVIRFYQMQQFFALLTIYLFCYGFVTAQKQSYRIATLLVFLCAVLSQEISAVMGVPLLLGYVLFAKDLGWRSNIQLVIISTVVVALIALDLLAFKTLCLTRTEGVSPSIEAAIKPHFWYPMNLFSIFIGYSRLHVVPSFFCLLGLPLFWREKNRNAFALAMFLFSGVLLTNLLVSHISLRYQYWLFPVWILVCMVSIRLVLLYLLELSFGSTGQVEQSEVAELSESRNESQNSPAALEDCTGSLPEPIGNRRFALIGMMAVTIFCSIIISWSPWRMPGTYELKILGDSTGCVRWVQSQMRAGDKLAVTEPHTHAGFLEAGKVDYDVAIPLLYDFAVFQDGRLIDRNGGGEIVSSVDQLMSVLEKQDRVWILLNREKFRTRGKNLRWEYPGARFEMFLRKNCELKHRTYLWHAYLWDSSRGHLVSFGRQQ